MNHLHTKLLASAVAALIAVPAFAAEATHGGSEGTGEAPRGGFGTFNFTKVPEPIAPKLDGEPSTRSLLLDPAQLERSYGTVSRKANGETTTTPPSDELKRAIFGEDAGDMRGVEPNSDQEETRDVIGRDDRVQITNSNAYPFRTIGLLLSLTAEGEVAGACSGALIGPRTVLTAAHCLYDHDAGWGAGFVFAPGMVEFPNAPFGASMGQEVFILEGYISNYQGQYAGVIPWDIGVVRLADPIGEQLGYLDFGYDDALGDFTANVVGYPGDKPAGTMWRVACDVPTEAMTELYWLYDCDSVPGSSGSAVYVYNPQDKSRVIYGVNVAGGPEFNVAKRINSTVFQWLIELWQ